MIQRFFGTRYFTVIKTEYEAEKAAYFESIFEELTKAKKAPPIKLSEKYAKHEFLSYMINQKGLLARGSNQAETQLFEPQEGTDFFGNPTGFIVAAEDGIWPIFFAIINRDNEELHAVWNACKWVKTDAGELHKLYSFSLNQEAFFETTFGKGFVYLLPREGFKQVASKSGLPTVEWVNRMSVRPLASLPVSPSDFPFLEQVKRFDLQDLMTLHRTLCSITRIVERTGGFALYIDRRKIPVEEIERTIRFMQAFYPSWRLRITERLRDEALLEIRFPTGVIKFCKQELMEDIQELHTDFFSIVK
jgi:hypothetical protein